MNIDQFGIIRDPSGTKVAVFKDPSLGQRFIDLAGLLTSREASDLVNNLASGDTVKLDSVTMWKVSDGH